MLKERIKLLIEYSGTHFHKTPSGEEKVIPYYTRVDPLIGNVAKISEERIRRSVGISVSLDMQPAGRCEFCDYNKFTPEPRIEHDCGAVSVPSKYPWEEYDWITIYPPFGKHKLLLSDLYFEDHERMIESSYDLALICSKDNKVIAFKDFTNWGAFAGASQQHPHSQRKSITHKIDPAQERELNFCREIKEIHGRNYFDLLYEEEEEDGKRIIYNNDVFIVAAFAPVCPNELLVFPREEFSHILQMNYRDRKRIIDPIVGIFPALFFYSGVTNLNIAIHMAPFQNMEDARKYYRWHMHIYPRRSELPVDKAGAELGFWTNVIDTFPEKTAEVVRRWYTEGPNKELLAKSDGKVNPDLLREFERIFNASNY